MVFFSDHGEDVYDTPPHEMLGRSEGKPSRIIYNVPFLVWQSPEWLATHQFDLNDKTARPFSNMDFIYAWSDLAGLNYTGFDPEKPV